MLKAKQTLNVGMYRAPTQAVGKYQYYSLISVGLFQLISIFYLRVLWPRILISLEKHN